jgi:hypothetical protein
MSDPVLISLIVATGPTLIGLYTLYLQYHNKNAIQEIKTATDGMKTELVKVTRSDALQEGHSAGVADQKDAQRESGREGDTKKE